MRFPLLGSWQDEETNEELVHQLYVAKTFWQRFLGLQGLPPLEADSGLLLRNCSSIHTMWMRFPIDVVFLDDDYRVVERRENIKPWRFVIPKKRGAKHVIEVTAGSELAIEPGQRTAVVEAESKSESQSASEHDGTPIHPEEKVASEPSEGPSAAMIVGIALIMVALWLVVWRGSLDGVFHFDDHRNIVNNEQIRQIWPLDDFLKSNRPIGLYSFALNYHFSGSSPSSYHLVNLGIHITNGLFAFAACLLAWQLYRRNWCADARPSLPYSMLIVAGLASTAWVVHPLTTQAVTNTVQRYESLASLGYLGAGVGMLVYLSGRRWLGCAIVLPMAWIGLMSKEIFATAPLAILLFDRLVTRSDWVAILKQRWLPYALSLSPFIWFFPSVFRWLNPVQVSTGSSMGFGLESISSWEYLRTQPEIIWHYLYLTIWPKQLCFDYVWTIQDKAWVYLSLGLLILAMLSTAGWMYWRGAVQRVSFSAGLAGWLLLTFFLILAPTSSIIPIADLAFEHRMYLASLCIVSLIVLGAAFATRKLLTNSQRPVVLQVGFACVAVTCIGLLAWRTQLRNQDYRDGLRLWTTAVKASPENPRAWYNVGRELIARGNPQAALKPMINAVGYSNSSVPKFDVGLASCLAYAGKHEDAITLYKRALEKKPEYEEAMVGLADCTNQIGQQATAIELYEQVLESNPTSMQALNDLGVIFLEREQADKAQLYFQQSAELGSHEALYNLGWLELKNGQVEKSVLSFNEALTVAPDFHAAARRLAWIYATSELDELRNPTLARKILDEHFDLSTTGAATVLDTDGAIRAALGDFEGALQSARKALEIASNRKEREEAFIVNLKKRIDFYRSGQPWVGGFQS
ncbi:MAG: tetratricopeptide repeat protein [Planctomycetota bacterium]